MPAGVGYEPTPCRIASQAFTAPRPEIARPLSHGGRLQWALNNFKMTFELTKVHQLHFTSAWTNLLASGVKFSQDSLHQKLLELVHFYRIIQRLIDCCFGPHSLIDWQVVHIYRIIAIHILPIYLHTGTLAL